MRVLEIRTDYRSVIDKLVEFSNTKTYSILYNLWLGEREALISKAKMEKDLNKKGEYMCRLEGFDMAASIVQKAIDEVRNRQKAEADPGDDQ